MNPETRFVFGIRGLDEVYKDALRPGMLIALAGHPGAGKTTLAALMCIANIARGHKCLFVSTQEDESRVCEHLGRLGLDISKYINSEDFKFVKVPMPSSDEAVDSIVETIASYVLKYHPTIVVVDSLSSIIKILADVKRRALLQNFFSGLARDIGGLVIVTVEMSLGTELITDTGDIEFVSDAIIVLKHHLKNGTLSRKMEIRKLRGHPIEVAEVPFTIVNERGIEVAVAHLLGVEKRKERVFKFSSETIDEVTGGFKSGEVITLAFSHIYLSKECAVRLAEKISRENSARVLLFSLMHLGQTETSPDRGEVVVVSSDPTRESLEDITIKFHRSLLDIDPDVVITFGLNILNTMIGKEESKPLTRNLLMNAEAARKLGVSLIRLIVASSIDDPLFVMLSQLSDIVVFIGDTVSKTPESQSLARIRGYVKFLNGRNVYRELCED